jgi:hypothetical protein
MQPSPSPFLIRAAAVAGFAAVVPFGPAGCSDDTCGPGDAPRTVQVAAGDTVSVSYGELSGLLGNDCPAPGAPAGVISLSIEGRQTDDPAGLITLCVPRPDLLMEGARSLGTTLSAADVRIIDLQGKASGCSFTLDTAQPPTGTAQATGVCDNGDSPAGFALTLDGAISLRRTCGATVDTLQATLRGQVAISRRAM